MIIHVNNCIVIDLFRLYQVIEAPNFDNFKVWDYISAEYMDYLCDIQSDSL